MKIRSGFVSNSSSSNFLIIGTENIDKIARKIGLLNDENNYSGWTENENIVGAGYGGAELVGKGFSDESPYVFYGTWDEPYYFGIDVEQSLRAGQCVPNIKSDFIKRVKEDFGIILDWDEVDIHFGEIGM